MAQPFHSSSWYRVAGLRPALRPHGHVEVHRYQGGIWYVLRDHASNRVHRFTPAAYAILGAMDGARSLDDIWAAACADLGEHAPAQDEVVRLLAQLHQQDLLQTEIPADAQDLLERLSKHRRGLRRRSIGNPISIQIPLWNPDRALAAIVAALGWMPLPILAILWLSVVGTAIGFAALHADALGGDPLDRVLSAQNLIVLAAVYPLVKALHELGHGLAAKAFGGAVNETGIMLLAFLPVPYVDVSSAQALQSKYERALVGAAGMMVEVFVAAIAFFFWLNAEPGFAKAAAYNVMLIAGFSTLIVNGNPLLRYDAYFILCDLAELPNLGPRANQFWQAAADRRLFGADVPRTGRITAAERIWFILYAPAAYLYRLFVLFGIALFVAGEYLFLGVLAACWAVATGLLLPLGKALAHVATGARLERHRRRALGVTLGGLAALAGFLILVPMPQHSVAEGLVWLPEDAQVRAGADGFLDRVVAAPGSQVRPGDVLLRLRDPLLETRAASQRLRIAEAEARLASERFGDQGKVEIIRQEIDAARGELARLEDSLAHLTAPAALAGTFVLPRAQSLPGRFFRQGEVIGYVTPPDGGRLRLLVGQDEIDLVRGRLRRVEAKLVDRPAETFRGAIVREVPQASDVLPSKVLAAAGGGSWPTDPSDPAGLRALQRPFQFDVSLTPVPDGALFGTRAHIRLELAWEPLGPRLARRLRQVFLTRFHA